VKIRSRKDACAGRRCIIEIDCVNLNGPRYVLEILPTKLPAADRNFPLNLIEDLARNANASAVSDTFEPRCDIDAITEDIASIFDNVTDINARTQFYLLISWNIVIAFMHTALKFHRATYGFYDTRKFCKKAVSGVFDYTATVFGDLGINQLG